MKKLGSLAGLTTSSFLCHSTWKYVSVVNSLHLIRDCPPPPQTCCRLDRKRQRGISGFGAIKQTRRTNVDWYDRNGINLIYMPYWFDHLFPLCGECSFYCVAAGDLCSHVWSLSETDHDLCSLCALLQKSKLMLFLFWCTLRLARLFSCSHLTSHRLQSSYGTAALLSVLLPVSMPQIIGLSSSCMLSLFSPRGDFCSDVLFCWTAVGTFPSYFSANRPLHCWAAIG